MAILIKGMEMPKKSGQYVLYLDVYGDPPARPPDVHMADCVRYFVFEVPEPHGRLGDLDELYNHLNEWYLTHEHGFSETEKIYIRAMLSGVKDAPTVIEAEEGE